MAVAAAAAAACRQRGSIGGSGQRVGSATAAGTATDAAATAMLRRCGGNEGTGSNSNGGGIDNNQQSSKFRNGNGDGNGNGDSKNDDNGNLKATAAVESWRQQRGNGQQQQLKKLGIIIHYLDKFNHNWSLHTLRAPGQTQHCSRNHWRGLLSFQGFHLGTYGILPYNCCLLEINDLLYVVVQTLLACVHSASSLPASQAALIANSQ